MPEYFVVNLLQGSGVGGQFGLLEWSARMSAQAVGTRTTGVSWGQSFTDTRMVDGSRSIEWGAFNPALRQTNFSTTTTLYNQSRSVISALVSIFQTTGKVGLKDKDQQKYDKEREKLLKRLGEISQKCRDLLAKVGGVGKVIEAIDLQRAFDGETSTISAFDAGLLDNKELNGIDDKNRQFLKAQSVSDSFGRKDNNAAAVTALYPRGEIGKTVEERSDIYFRPDRGFFGYGERSGLNQRTILHESLHSLTGLGDIDLLEKLTGRRETSYEVASKAITAALVNNDCVK